MKNRFRNLLFLLCLLIGVSKPLLASNNSANPCPQLTTSQLCQSFHEETDFQIDPKAKNIVKAFCQNNSNKILRGTFINTIIECTYEPSPEWLNDLRSDLRKDFAKISIGTKTQSVQVQTCPVLNFEAFKLLLIGKSYFSEPHVEWKMKNKTFLSQRLVKGLPKKESSPLNTQHSKYTLCSYNLDGPRISVRIRK
ncbi:MAG: hypothetical protein WCG05_03500 [Alphaproteobacteria bacterium]